MSWRQKLRTLFRSGSTDTQKESIAAVEAADRSLTRAVEDRQRAAATRAQADVLAQQVRAHNVANRYDTWLREVMRGEG